jgi:hypothetical protein
VKFPDVRWHALEVAPDDTFLNKVGWDQNPSLITGSDYLTCFPANLRGAGSAVRPAVVVENAAEIS